MPMMQNIVLKCHKRNMTMRKTPENTKYGHTQKISKKLGGGDLHIPTLLTSWKQQLVLNAAARTDG